jgi:hypothetical protein
VAGSRSIFFISQQYPDQPETYEIVTILAEFCGESNRGDSSADVICQRMAQFQALLRRQLWQAMMQSMIASWEGCRGYKFGRAKH